VLYIEDNPANARLMQHVADDVLDCHLRVAGNAEEGLRLAITDNPDLILMDLNLPGMYGIDAIRVLKSDPELATIPVIAVSADAMPETIAEATLAGAVDFVVKPFQLDALVAAIHRAIKPGNTN
jgi:CheY-like chemotaxis protein